MSKSFYNLACFLILIFPILIITGPFLSDSAVIIIDLIFIYRVFLEKDFEILRNKYFYFLIFFFSYFSLRSLFVEDILFSFKSSFTYIRFIIFIFAISYFLKNNKKLFNFFSKIFLFTIFIVCIDALFQYKFGFNFLGFEIENPDKLNGLFGDEAVLGSFLVRLTPLLFAVLFYYLKPDKNIFIVISILLLIELVIFLSGSRSSLFLMILFVSLMFLTYKNLRKPILIFNLIAICLFFGFSKISSQLEHSIYYSLKDPFKTMFPKNVDTGNEKKREIIIFTKVYDSHYKTAYNMFQKNKIFGVGTKMYRKLCDDKKYYVNKFSCTTHPHNFYLQLLAENGLLGIFFLIIPFFVVIKLIFSKIFYVNFFSLSYVKSNSSLMIIYGIFINLWPFIPSGNLFNNWLSILIFFPLGFYQFLNTNNESS